MEKYGEVWRSMKCLVAAILNRQSPGQFEKSEELERFGKFDMIIDKQGKLLARDLRLNLLSV